MSRWSQLVEHAEEQTEQASQALAAVRGQIATVESQRQQMQAYRQDYAERAAAPGTATTVLKLNLVRDFGDQVQSTVDELDKQLLALRERYEALREAWGTHYKREQALKALQRLEQQRQAATAERHRRREEDDFVMQAKRREQG